MHRTTPLDPHPAGTVLIIVLAFVLMIAGVAIPALTHAVQAQQAAHAGMTATKLLLVAESALNYAYSELEKDPVYAVLDETAFAWNPTSRSYEWVDAQPLAIAGDTTNQMFHISIQYLRDSSGPLQFGVRGSPTERFDRIKVTAKATAGGHTREIVAWYAFRFGFRGAIVSDNVPAADEDKAKGKSFAKLGHIVFDGNKGSVGEHVVYGDLHANGQVVYHDGKEAFPLTTGNASDHLHVYHGMIHANLAGGLEEIPDFTNLGSQRQLFDFPRLEAAAAKGAGAVYHGLDAFRAALVESWDTGEPLEGIIFVKVDPGVEGKSPKISGLPINVTGTLVFDFADGTEPDYKVVLDKDVPVHVNAADLSEVDFADPRTYTSGYPGKYVDEQKQPFMVDITSEGYDNFTANDDLPAVMFNNGIVDFHGELNICGVVYGPAFVEIENKGGNVMYINGAVFGGGGIYMQANKDGQGIIAIHHDANTTDDLELFDTSAASFERVGYSVTK